MPNSLLEKTRRLNRILQSSGTQPVSFSDVANILNEVLDANVYVVSRKGKILGYSLNNEFICDLAQQNIIEALQLPDDYNKMLLTITETRANIRGGEFCDISQGQCPYPNRSTTIVPINGGRQRLGTLLFYRFEKDFTNDDLVLAEYSATVVGMEIMRAKSEEIEEEARKTAIVQLAIGTLSYSELQAVGHIFQELDGNEGLLVASKIADRVGITRSVIVNALRKFESAGVIESRSLGMKGTHIRILNEKLLDELQNIK